MSNKKYTPEMIDFVLELKSKGLTNKEVLALFNKQFNLNRNLGTVKDIFAHYKPIDDQDLEDLAFKLEKDNFRIKDKNQLLQVENTVLVKNSLRQETLTEEVERIFKNVKFNTKSYKSSFKKKRTRELNLVLSDLHFGSDISKDETGKSDYGTVEEARRFAYIIKEVIKFKEQYRDETNLNVLLLGDIIQNNLHDPRDAAPMAEQVSRAIYLINQGIAQLAANFPKIRVYCNSGNHGRALARHPNRAVNQKWDSVETIIYYAAKESLRTFSNVEFIIPKTPFVSYSVFDKKIFATHGDTVLNPGYPGKAIKTGVLENQINRINAALKDADEYSVFIVGHVHTASTTHLSNGAVMITNGALVPSDEFAISIGLMESSAGQFIFESVENFPVGDSRYIKVSDTQDQDSSLDKIIKPWMGFNEDSR